MGIIQHTSVRNKLLLMILIYLWEKVSRQCRVDKTPRDSFQNFAKFSGQMSSMV